MNLLFVMKRHEQKTYNMKNCPVSFEEQEFLFKIWERTARLGPPTERTILFYVLFQYYCDVHTLEMLQLRNEIWVQCSLIDI